MNVANMLLLWKEKYYSSTIKWVKALRNIY